MRCLSGQMRCSSGEMRKPVGWDARRFHVVDFLRRCRCDRRGRVKCDGSSRFEAGCAWSWRGRVKCEASGWAANLRRSGEMRRFEEKGASRSGEMRWRTAVDRKSRGRWSGEMRRYWIDDEAVVLGVVSAGDDGPVLFAGASGPSSGVG